MTGPEVFDSCAAWPGHACAYCGALDVLRRCPWFSHPACAVCLEAWYDDGPGSVAELKTLSLARRAARRAPPKEAT